MTKPSLTEIGHLSIERKHTHVQLNDKKTPNSGLSLNLTSEALKIFDPVILNQLSYHYLMKYVPLHTVTQYVSSPDVVDRSKVVFPIISLHKN